MNFEVPLSMREARREMLLALASSREVNATHHCRRAANLLNDAVSSIQAHPAADYDWSLLRAEHR
ncbi:hypothetical protein [Aurantiacibacter hainanensis]|uniref:hypothetical protein n=1 Tax=Aurantiacibacter hainanensis TaxID=3076114 RepID=UPI0030C69631